MRYTKRDVCSCLIPQSDYISANLLPVTEPFERQRNITCSPMGAITALKNATLSRLMQTKPTPIAERRAVLGEPERTPEGRQLRPICGSL